MRKPVFYMAIILCLVLIVPVVWSCSETEENTFVKLLKLLPETAREGRIITLIDYEKWREVNGISIYDENGRRINREEYFNRISTVYDMNDVYNIGFYILQYGSYYTGIVDKAFNSPIQDESIGYNIVDVDAEINNIYSVSLTSSGIGRFDYNFEVLVAAVGDFYAQSTKQALNNRDEWPSRLIDNYVSEDYNGITIHNWGDYQEFSLADRLSPPHVDNIGRAIPIAVSDGYLFIGSNVGYIKSMIDASQNELSSLADIPEYVLIAKCMHYLDSIEIIIVDELLIRDILASAESYYGTKLENFTTIGMGHGKDDNGEYMAVVIVFENPKFAEENAPLLEQRIEAYNNLIKMSIRPEDHLIYDTEISIDDKVLHAKLYTDDELLWRRWFFNELPIMYQE